MQKLKKDIRKQVIIQVKNEFTAKGFKDASMHIIAKNAKVGLSNIYNYFKNKDEIFQGNSIPGISSTGETDGRP